MKQTARLLFHSQHRTPVLPTVPVSDGKVVNGKIIRVAYLLSRNQIVKHSPHPLENEMAFTLEREYARYSRHDGDDTATGFMGSRGHAIDTLNRTDPKLIEGNFYGLELYQDAMKVALQRYAPQKRVCPADLYDPCDPALAQGPPKRHTLQRALDDYLYLIVQDSAHGKWTLPMTERLAHESLRMTVDRAIATHHDEQLDTYIWSNAPQGVLKADANPVDTGATEALTFLYSATYLAGRPQFDRLGIRDHAWVRRAELAQYASHFEHPEMYQLLMDITTDSTFDGPQS